MKGYRFKRNIVYDKKEKEVLLVKSSTTLKKNEWEWDWDVALQSVEELTS